MTRDDDGRDGGSLPAGGDQHPSDDEVWAGLVASFNAPPEQPVGRWPASEDVQEPDGQARERSADSPYGGDLPYADGDAPDGGGAPGDDPPREGRILRPVLGAPFGVPAPPTPPAGADQPRDEAEHYVPPPPPPIPRGDAVSRAAWAAALGGPGLLMVAAILGVGLPSWLVGLCVAGFVGGFATLVLRLRGHDPYDPDDGAVV
jgi:hypothetical protein